MAEFGQLVLGGLGFGGIYALAALGLVLIFKTSGVVNFAFGAMATVVTLMLWTLLEPLGLPVVVAWLLALAVGLLLGGICEVLLLRRIANAAPLIQIALTLGLLLVIQGLSGVVWGFSPKDVPRVVHGASLSVGPVLLDLNDVFIVVLTLVLGGAFFVIFERTRAGLAMRAIAQDRDTAELMGIPVRRFITASWAVGVLVSGVAANLVAPTVSLAPTMMDNIAVFAFAAAVLGGFGSLAGALVGGFAIGVVSNLVAGYLSNDLQLSIVFLLIVVILYVRPQGLFGVAADSRQ